MNTKQEEALEKLLERKGYTIYELNILKLAMVIEGSADYKKDYDFKVDIPLPIVRDEGKNMLDMVVQEIEKYLQDIEDISKGFLDKKDFKSKEKSNPVLVEMFEQGITNFRETIIDSSVVGRKQGKTSTIVYMAQKYNLPIIVSQTQFRNMLLAQDENLKVYSMTDSGLDGLNSKLVLIDELEEKYVDMIRGTYQPIGIVKKYR